MKAGDRIGPYRLVEELGSGATGTVFLAREGDGCAARTVAVKVFHPHLTGRAGFVARFAREAEAGRRVEHENVVRVLEAEFFVADGEPCYLLVMEPVAGRTLRRVLREDGPLPEPLLRVVALEAAKALAAVHAAGLVHRDVKPDNLILTDDGRLRLMDLGVARLVDASRALTQPHDFVGTLLYAAPEVLGGEPAGPAADLYALGVTLFELAAGRNPYLRESAAAIVRAHLDAPPASVLLARPDLSAFLAAVVESALGKRPEDRPDGARTLVAILAEGEASAWFARRRHVVRATAAQRAARPFVARTTSMHGRNAELATLRERFEAARRGAGGGVRVEGEAGLGKSRLLDAFVEGLAPDVRVLAASFAPDGEGRGLAASLRPVLGPDDVPLAQRLGDLASYAVALQADATGAPRPPDAAPAPAEARPTLFARVLASLASEGPLVWLVEDAHFASPEDLATVRRLARAAASTRALVVSTARPGPSDDAAAWAALPSAVRLPLRRLSPREVIELLREVVGSPSLAERLGGKIAYHSDGVPFHVFEILRGLREGRFLSVTPDGEWIQTRDVDRIEVPPSLREVLEARLAACGPEQRRVLDAACLLGDEFDPEIVAIALDQRVIRVLETLAAIERQTGLVRGLAQTTRFDHHLVQETLRSALPPRLRAELHAELARAYDVRDRDDELVTRCRHHLLGARPDGARPLLERALARLRDASRFGALTELAEAALAAPGLVAGRERLAVVESAGLAAIHRGRTADADRHTAEAVELAVGTRDARLEAHARVGRARALARVGRGTGSLEELRLAEARLEAGDAPAEERATVRSFTALALHAVGRVDEALAAAESARAILPASSVVARANVGIALGRVLAARGRAGDALAAMHDADAGGRSASDALDALLDQQRSAALVTLGRFAEARAVAERAVERTRAGGMTMLEANAIARRALVATEAGDLSAALDDTRLARSLAEAAENAGALLTCRLLAARLVAWGGDARGARAALEDAGTASQAGHSTLWTSLRSTELAVTSITHAPADALATLERIAQDPRCSEDSGVTTRLRLLRVELAALAGVVSPSDVDAARRAEGEARAEPCPSLVARAVAVRALLRDADPAALHAARAAAADASGRPSRCRTAYLAWRAFHDVAPRVEALAELAAMRRGLPSPEDELPFVRELRGEATPAS